jgi:hypothetical protein
VETIFNVLIGVTALVGLAVALYGLYSLVTGQVHTLDRESGETRKVAGGKARRTGLYLFVAGTLWVIYAGWRFIDGL